MIVDTIHGFGQGLVAAGWWTGLVWPVVWTLIKIIIVVIPLMLAVAYLTLWERHETHLDPAHRCGRAVRCAAGRLHAGRPGSRQHGFC